MPKALIFGLDLGGSTPAQVSSHERTVKEAFLAVAPNGWTADIIISTGRPELFTGYAPVHATISSTGVFDFATNLVPYVQENDIYDIIVYSYSSSGGRVTESNLDAILSTTNVQAVFSSMGNSGDQQKYASDIWWMGGGVTENIRQGGYKCFGWEDGVAGAGFTTDTFTSETASTSAGHFASFVDLGLTKAQTRKAFIQAFPNYPTKDIQDGYGLAPVTPVIPEAYDVLPPWSLWAYIAGTYREDGVIRGYPMYLFWCPVLGQSETVRIYRNDELIYEGTGVSSPTSNGYFGTSRGKQWEYLLTENGTSTFTITHVDGTESDTAPYSTDAVTVANIVSPAPPEPPPAEPEPESPTEVPPVNPTPNVFLSRTGNILTATTDGGGTTTEWQIRTNIQSDWTTRPETSQSLTLTVPLGTTLQVRARIDGVSDYGQAFSTALAPSAKRLFIP
jgi:hypothetical protein